MWYDDLKYASSKIQLNHEGLTYKDKVVPQGAQIKFRYRRGTFLFGSVVTNTETGAVWIDCREYVGRKAGKWHSIPLDQFSKQVLPKKVRAKESVRQPASAS